MTNKTPKRKGSRAKLRDFLIANVGKILNSDTLREKPVPVNGPEGLES